MHELCIAFEVRVLPVDYTAEEAAADVEGVGRITDRTTWRCQYCFTIYLQAGNTIRRSECMILLLLGLKYNIVNYLV